MRLKLMARCRKFLLEFEAGNSRDKKLVTVYACQPMESFNQDGQLSGQMEGVVFKLASD
jgi:hypothetical protein